MVFPEPVGPVTKMIPSFFDNAILIDSTSKRYSLCGARIGFIVSKNSNFIETCLKFALARLSPPTLALIAANKALNSDQKYINDVISEYSHRRELLIDELSKINDIAFSNPMGAFYSIIKLPVKNAEDFCKVFTNRLFLLIMKV